MDRYSMLGHVVPNTTLQVENVATEALSYLLQSYKTAGEALVGLASSMGLAGDDDLTFGTQVRMRGGGIPDLVGVDSGGTQVLLVESKFWAPLTPNQPTGYMRLLPPDEEGLVLFIAPEARHQTLWGELMNRCRAAGLEPRGERGESPGWRAARIPQLGGLAYASWSYVLDHLEERLQYSGEDRGAHELWQLRGLCERLEKDGTPPTDDRDGLRLIVNDVAKGLVERGIFRTKGYGVARGPTYYRKYGTMRDRINWFVEYDMQRASNLGESQLWVGGPWEEEMAQRLTTSDEGSHVRFHRQGREVVFPLNLPTEADPGVIVRDLTTQVENIVDSAWEPKRP